ncbi:MAG: cytochrome c-type biogenesis protein CcmH [Deltaproteobacteria bacterium]|nr:cytochrome c-type biogenesis protein CcmH [Deltaproteobacteria bacterium]
MKHVICVIMVGFGCLAAVGSVAAEGEDLDTKARAIADQLRCPVCRGVPITESPAELAQDMMKIIRGKLAAGETEAQILQYFADRYGDWILLSPRAEGMNFSLWILPGAFLLGGAGLIVRYIRRRP